MFIYPSPLPKPLPPQNLTRNPPHTPKSLPLAHSIVVIPDIDRYLSKFQFLQTHLLDELRRIFHTVHSEDDFFNSLNPEHPVPIVGIGQADSRDCPREPLPSPKRESSEKRDIGLGFLDKTRTKYYV